METRQKTNKVLHGGHTFTPIDRFSPGLLPTSKQVIQRLLAVPYWKTNETINKVSKELITLWVWSNVYTLSERRVFIKIQDLATQFNRLFTYPKGKRELSKFKLDINSFMELAERLFDIFCSDENQRRVQERQYQLRMTDADYLFYQDQSTTRTGRCLGLMKGSQSDLRYRRRIHNQSEAELGEKRRREEDQVSIFIAEPEVAKDMEAEICEQGKQYDVDMIKQNRMELENLARACDRFQISNRAGAAIASAVLKDAGFITDDDNTYVIDKNKLKRQREKYRKKIQEEETAFFSEVNCIYVDGRKDATLMTSEVNGKCYRVTNLEEHYVIVGEPGEYYLSHVSPEDGKGQTIARAIYNAIENTELEKNLQCIGSDGTATMIGANEGAIRKLEELLGRPLQWSICLLHCNELPLRHIIAEIDGGTKGPESFSGDVCSTMGGSVSEWGVVNFEVIHNNNFPVLPKDLIDELSSDQYYAYRICKAVMSRGVDEDLEMLEVGPLNHSRWLTCGNRILRKYVSESEPSPVLKTLAKYCILVYFPSWFHIKLHNNLADGSKNFYHMLALNLKFPDSKVKEIVLKVLRHNAFFAHEENVLIAMLSDQDGQIRNIAVNRILALRQRTQLELFPITQEKVGDIEPKSENNYPILQASLSSNVRIFKIPEINVKSKNYYQMTSLELQNEPPATMKMTNDEFEDVRMTPLKIYQPCHNQCVERHIKLVTEASYCVVGFESRDGFIRQKIRSRKLMKSFDTKKDFV